MKQKRVFTLAAMVWLGLGAVSMLQSAPLGTSFSYQGRLTDESIAKNGACDLRFSLFDALTDGSQVGITVTKTGVAVTNGLFTAQLDFGAGVFNGSARWLQTEVMCTGDPSYTALSPRQELTAAPQALYAAIAGESLGGVQQTSFTSVGRNATVSVTGKAVLGVYRSTAVDIGGTNYYRIPYPSGHLFNTSTARATDESYAPAWPAVDTTLESSWMTDSTPNHVKFNFDLGTGRVVRGLVMVNETGTAGVQAFRVYGTNDAAAFSSVDYNNTTSLTLLGTHTAAMRSDYNPQHFSFANSTAYRYIVILIDTNYGQAWVGFRHVQMLWPDATGAAYELLRPVVDYTVSRTSATGSQSMTIRKISTGTDTIVVDYQ